MSTTSSPEVEKKCWICLETGSSDESKNDWIKICGCNLLAHESCILKWASSLDTSGSMKSPMCPQCQRPIVIIKKKSTFLDTRDSIESTYSNMTLLMLAGGLATGVIVMCYTTLYLSGAAIIYQMCPKDMANEVLGAIINDDGTKTLVLSYKPVMVPIALVLSRYDTPTINTFLCLLPSALMTSENVPFWKFRNERLYVALYPYLRLLYLKIYKLTLFPYFEHVATQLSLADTNSSDGGNIFEDINVDVVIQNNINEFDNDQNGGAIVRQDAEQENDGFFRRYFFNPALGFMLQFLGDDEDAPDGDDQDDGALLRANRNDQIIDPERVISKRRWTLDFLYTLSWPWLSGFAGALIFRIPYFGRKVPSKLTRNLIGSIMVVLVRDLVNVYTAHQRLKREKSRYVEPYVPSKQLQS